MGAPFDVDAFAKEAAQEPFEFVVGGETFRMASMRDIDWEVSVEVEDLGMASGMERVIAETLGDDQFERFRAHKLSMHVLNAILERSMKHFGIDPKDPLRSARRSPRTARR